MRKDETLELYKRGKEAWNNWAKKMLVQRTELERAGKWVSNLNSFDERKESKEATRQWLEDARVDFTSAVFGSGASFGDFLFPSEAVFAEAGMDGEVDFDGATFKGNARFRGARFSGIIIKFRRVSFEGIADFTDAIFSSITLFSETEFSASAYFTKVKFNEEADFGRARFSGAASFLKAAFVLAVFERATFKEDTLFLRARFTGPAFFSATVFERDVTFRAARFDDEANFEQSKFFGPSTFSVVLFSEFTYFTDATFTDEAFFIAIKGDTYFSLRGATFSLVPDFSQARFDEVPTLDECYFNKERKFSDRHPSRWRALKRLAIQAHDHEREQMFFAEEIKSLRGVEDFPLPILSNRRSVWPGGGRYWAGFLYQYLSDFGRSIFRPIAWWILVAVASWGSFLHYHLISNDPPKTFFEWVLGTSTSLPFTDLSCANSPHFSDEEGPAGAAAYLALHNGIVFSGIGRSDKAIQSYSCLYGRNESFTRMPNKIIVIGVIQTIISAILIFLLGLAMRNKFRIK